MFRFAWWPGALGLALLSACTVAAAPPPTASPTPLPSSKVGVADLSGDWLWGEDTPEPGAGPFVACAASRPLSLKQEGQVLTGHLDTCAGPCLMGPPLVGKNEDGQVRLQGEADDLQLTYQAATQHLVGTRNGKPFWAVPFIRSTQPDCANRVY